MRRSLLIALVAFGCGPDCDELRIERGSELVASFCVTHAVTESERRQGLAGSSGLAPSDALVIEFPLEGDACITNAPVTFAIDIAFAGDDGVVRRIDRSIAAGDATSRCEPATRRVLEARGGALDAVSVGDLLR